jgi:hypothetical protein
MITRTPKRQEIVSFVLCALAAAPAAALGSACAYGDQVTTGAQGSVGSGGGSGGEGGAGAGEVGGASNSSSSAASGTGGGDVKCKSDGDCMAHPAGPVCDTETGDCVGCLPANDTCPTAQFCDPAVKACAPGCKDDADCAEGAAARCDVAAHACVECLADADCAPGTICIGAACVPGCSPTQDCQPGFTCCGSTCFDLLNDVEHCGDCLNPCETPAHASVSCNMGACQMGACDAAWGNCDFDFANGCEWNVLQDGACLCSPGAFQICYTGPLGTLGVGPCKAGIQFCEPSGAAWGPCNGQVVPVSEVCANNVDEDCNGAKDDPPDYDGDGWTACQGDCCDLAGGCADPAHVNPGAFEVVGNGVNDDCDASTSDAVAPAACSTLQDFSAVTAIDVAKAMELCRFTTQSPQLPDKKWGVITAQHLLANGNVPSNAQLIDMQNYQTAILTNYGTGGIVPKKGPTMAGISTGRMRDAGDPDYMPPNGGYEFGYDSTPPAAYLAAHGGSLPSSAGCSGACPAGSGASDPVNIRLKIRVPTNAQSFSYDFRFVSAEYWTWTCTTFNDFFLALLQTSAPGIPADKNISFDSKNNPVSVNNGFFDVCVPKGCYDCPAGDAPLNGTGMELGNTGGATKWLTTDAPVAPGETMQLELMIFDVTDNVLDSLALLDNFRWNLTPAVVETHE